MNRVIRSLQAQRGRWPGARCWAALSGALLLWNCGGHVGDGGVLGGETHFLVTCAEGCGDGLSCIDGACTRRCEPGFSSCSELASNAECVADPERDERAVSGGTCDVPCAADLDCAPLGSGYACRAGACRAEPEDRQGALGRASQSLVRAVDVDTCDSGLLWAGGDRRSAEMHPGSDCLQCHDSTSKRPLILGGTVYPIGGINGPMPLDDCFGLEGIEVIVTDGDGHERSTVTNRAGNFYFEGRESDFPLPYQASVRFDLKGTEARSQMFENPFYGGCARCHNNGITPYEYGHQLYSPPLAQEDPEYVAPAFSPIFPFGLYAN